MDLQTEKQEKTHDLQKEGDTRIRHTILQSYNHTIIKSYNHQHGPTMCLVTPLLRNPVLSLSLLSSPHRHRGESVPCVVSHKPAPSRRLRSDSVKGAGDPEPTGFLIGTSSKAIFRSWKKRPGLVMGKESAVWRGAVPPHGVIVT